MNVSQVMAGVVAALEAGKPLHTFGDHEMVAAFEGAKHLRAGVVKELARRHGDKPVEEVRKLVLPIIGKLYGVPLVASTSNRNKGELTLDREAPRFEAAKTGLRDVVGAITGAAKRGTSNKADAEAEVEIPAELLAAAAKLAKLANEYEGARSLASRALAAAFAA